MENFRKNIAYKFSLIIVLFILSACLVYGANFLFNTITDVDLTYYRSKVFEKIASLSEFIIWFSPPLLFLSIGLRLIAILPGKSFLSFTRWKDFYFIIFFAGVTSFVRVNMVSWLLLVNPNFLPHITTNGGAPVPASPGVEVHPTLYAREYVADHTLVYMIFISMIITFLISISMLVSEIKRLKNEKELS